MAKNEEIEESRLVLVEGADLEYFLAGLLFHHGMRPGFQIFDFGGVDELRPSIKAFAAAPDFDRVDSLAVIRDAEGGPEAAERSVLDAVRDAGLNPPPEPGEFSDPKPAVGTYILPNNEDPGMLETLCLNAVQEDPMMGCVDDFIDCLDDIGEIPSPEEKARAYSFLATRNPPARLVGEGAHQGHWNLDHEAYEPLVDFLNEM